MKKRNILAIFIISYCISCGKDPKPTDPIANFMNMKTGGAWNYEVTNNTPPVTNSLYTLTSTSRDSIIDAKTYHVFLNSGTGSSEYYRLSGSDYYTYQSLPAALGGSKVENLYLKAGAALNTSWPQTYNIVVSSVPLAVTLTNKIVEKGISKTVNGKTYDNVIHVNTFISVAGIPPAALVNDINYYYAPNYGLIESSSKININYLTIVSNSDYSTKLKTAILL